MIEEYLNHRLEILTKQKNELKDQLISIRSSISTAKLQSRSVDGILLQSFSWMIMSLQILVRLNLFILVRISNMMMN